MAGPCSPKHDPVLITVLKNLFVWMLRSHLKTFKFMAVTRSPIFPVTAQLISRRWTILSSSCKEHFKQRLNERLVVLPQTRSGSLHVVKVIFVWMVKTFQKHANRWLGCASANTAQFLSRCWKTFSFGCYAAIQKRSSWWLGRSPTSPVTAQLISRRWKIFSFWCSADFQQRSNERLVVLLQTRSSAIHGVQSTFRPDGMKLSKTFEILDGSCSPKHGPVPLTVLKNFFVWMLCNRLKTLKLMAGPRPPTSPVTAQLILRRWRLFSSWCYANFQQRSNERLVVLPQTRSSSFHGIEKSFVGMVWNFLKTFKLWLICAHSNSAQFHSRCWRT